MQIIPPSQGNKSKIITSGFRTVIDELKNLFPRNATGLNHIVFAFWASRLYCHWSLFLRLINQNGVLTFSKSKF